MTYRSAVRLGLMGMLIATGNGCQPPVAPPAPVPEARPRLGAVMAEVGQRFERAGRAASAGRFALAAFESNELDELFTEDVPRAELPKEGTTAAIPALAAAFAKVFPARLKAAAAAHDLSRFRDAFREASVACNACHQVSGHGFIEVPDAMDQPVPRLDRVTPDAGNP